MQWLLHYNDLQNVFPVNMNVGLCHYSYGGLTELQLEVIACVSNGCDYYLVPLNQYQID